MTRIVYVFFVIPGARDTGGGGYGPPGGYGGLTVGGGCGGPGPTFGGGGGPVDPPLPPLFAWAVGLAFDAPLPAFPTGSSKGLLTLILSPPGVVDDV